MWDRLFGRRSNRKPGNEETGRGAGSARSNARPSEGVGHDQPSGRPDSPGRPPAGGSSDTPPDIRIETTAEGDIWWINLRGKLNGPDAAVRFTRAVESGLEKNFRKFLIDLGAASWVDSTGIGAIASTSVRVRDAGGSFVLTRVGDRIQRVLEVTRMDQVLDCEVDRERALRKLAG